MSSRAVCTSEGDQRCKYIHEEAVKARRTRKAPDFYCPESASKNAHRSKRTHSDDNDSWKPESESDDANSESDSEKSKEKRDKTGRRKILPRKSSSDHPDEKEMEGDPEGDTGPEIKDGNDAASESEADDDSPKEQRDDKQKQKKLKGCRELLDLYNGYVPFPKESRTRRLPPRHRTIQMNGHSESTWSNTSSKTNTDKDSCRRPETKNHVQSFKKQPSSLTTSSAQDPQKTVDSSTENPYVPDASETVDDDLKMLVATRRTTNNAKNDAMASTQQEKTTTADAADGLRVKKRQRLDVGASQMRMQNKPENTGHDAQPSLQELKDDPLIIKLPKMPMIRYGDYWYRARIKQETRESVLAEFTGFEDGMVKPFWIRKDSPDVFKGSYKGKDWKYAGDGAWEPKPVRVTKKGSNRGGRKGKRRPSTKTTETRDSNKSNRFNSPYSDQAYTADSEGCGKSGSEGIANDRTFYRSSAVETEKHEYSPRPQAIETEPADKTFDCDSHSDMHTKEMRSQDSFPRGQPPSTEAGDTFKDDNHKPGASPFSRIAGISGPSQIEDDTKQDKHCECTEHRKDSCSAGNEMSEERAPRLRRKAAKLPERKPELEPSLKNHSNLRRSARLGPNRSWKFKDSSSEAECEEDGSNGRRNGRPQLPKYITRSRNLETGGRRNSGAFSTTLQRANSQKAQRYMYSPELPIRKGGKSISGSQSLRQEVEELQDVDVTFQDLDEQTEMAGRSMQRTSDRRQSLPHSVDGATLMNLGIDVLSHIRKYVPYYTDHIPDSQLSAFMELMERLDGIRVQHPSCTTPLPSSTVMPSVSEVSRMDPIEKRS